MVLVAVDSAVACRRKIPLPTTFLWSEHFEHFLHKGSTPRMENELAVAVGEPGLHCLANIVANAVS